MDDFEIQFEDELEALRFVEEEYDLPVKGKKSLDFSSPAPKKLLPDSDVPHSSDPDSTEIINEQQEKDNSVCEESFLRPLEDSVIDEESILKTGESSESVLKTGESSESTLKTSESCERTKTDSELKKKQKRKRAEEELFGQVSDDNDEDDDKLYIDEPVPEPNRKKPRTVESTITNDVDDFVITPPPSPDVVEQILSKRTQHSDEITGRLHRIGVEERCRVQKRIPRGDYIPVTWEEGERFYLELKDEDTFDDEEGFSAKRPLKLLGTSLTELKMRVDEERERRVLRESKEITEIMNRSNKDDLELVEEIDHACSAEKPTALWVEKYAPRQYTDLLSDEATNRLLLKWLKIWDHVVFGKEKIIKKPATKEQKKETNHPKSKFNAKNITEELEEVDDHNRPIHKAVLLCGPPGLGKTTLAHVIAKHAGYNVVEMNASDDRSPDVFRTRIEAATQMKAVIGANPRPNCLIIDEIDGAPTPAINVLLSVIKGTDSAGGGKKKRRDRGLLMRPIICICNDLYATSLRQLRFNTLVIQFLPLIPTKLAQRLLEVARYEELKTDLTTLLALCEKADNDIRSCLNTLQFVRGRSHELSLNAVHSASLGQKDAHKTLFYVWQQIFQMPKQKRKHYVNPYDRGSATHVVDNVDMMAESNTSMAARFRNTLYMVYAAGEYEKVQQGLFENYLESKVKDPRMETILIANEWLGFVDQINREVSHTQYFTLGGYSALMPVAFHLLFACKGQQKVTYPHSQFECHSKLTKAEGLICAMLSDVAPAVRKYLNVSLAVIEVLSPLLEIIQPSLRPVNTQLYSAREKEDLSHLIEIMIAYNMTYHQERSIEGQYNYTLEPNLDEVVKFPGLKCRKPLTYAAKQLIAREIELEKMRRSEIAPGRSNEPAATSSDTAEKQTSDKQELPNFKRQKLVPKMVKETSITADLDFFGRQVVKKVTEAKPDANRQAIGGDIWFRFKEGFTNAVRKTVRVQDMM